MLSQADTLEDQAVQHTFDLPMKMENRIFRPRTSTKRSQACGHLVQAKSCTGHVAL